MTAVGAGGKGGYEGEGKGHTCLMEVKEGL